MTVTVCYEKAAAGLEDAMDWLPIDEFPESAKDGRDVLLWIALTDVYSWGAEVCHWANGKWRIKIDRKICGDPSHFVLIEPPSGC